MTTSYANDIYQMLCQKHPNRNIYIIGDQHFFHSNIIQYTRHQFLNVLEMNQYILKKHNEIVGTEDVVLLLGDFCFKNEYMKKALSEMNGYKYLILGNHDSIDLVKHYPNVGLEGVYLMPIKIGDTYLSHEPLMDGERNDLQFKLIVEEFKKIGHINYHGHIHTKNSTLPNEYQNATCEALDYQPLWIGKTKPLLQEEKPLFINSPYFDQVLTEITTKHSIQPQVLIEDYIYSMVLEVLSSEVNSYVVQGSFGLLKKYNFLTKMSDLDLSFLYDFSMSKNKNQNLLKEEVDTLFETLKKVDGINLRFLKRYVSLRILEAFYTSHHSYFAPCVIDANLIAFPWAKETDFIQLQESTLIEQYLKRKHFSMTQEYQFPNFQSQFLVPEGDMANLLLQVAYQQGAEEKKIEALRRLKYVYKYGFANQEMYSLDNRLSRFLLKNIAFLSTMNRQEEIAFIQNQKPDINAFMASLPNELIEQISEIWNQPYSEFSLIHDEISKTPVDKMFEKCMTLIKKG